MLKVRQNRCDMNQGAAFAAYMIADSYFKSGCSRRRFTRQYLHYAEMPEAKKLRAEDLCISGMEALGPEYLATLSTLRYVPYLFSRGEELVLRMETGFEAVEITISANGRSIRVAAV